MCVPISSLRHAQNVTNEIPVSLYAVILQLEFICLQEFYRGFVVSRREGGDRFQIQCVKAIVKDDGHRFLHDPLVLVEGHKLVTNLSSLSVGREIIQTYSSNKPRILL